MRTPPIVVPLLLASACAGDPAIGTARDRAQLYAELRDKTARREASSPVKNARLGLDVLAQMDALAPALIDARTEVDLYYALVALSAARRDRHLEVTPVPGGLDVPGQDDEAEAPIRFATDYGTPGAYAVFVADLDPASFVGVPAPSPGDRVLAVNGRPLERHVADFATYGRWSTVENLWWQVAAELNVRGPHLPPDRFEDRLRLELQGPDGASYEVSAPYLAPDAVAWTRPSAPAYPDMALAFETPTYALYRHTGGREVVLVRWLGFRETLMADVDRLAQYAAEEGLLGHALVVDATGSRGGDRGLYAIQRLTGRRFRSTFGNLRLSDVVPGFVEQVRAEVAAGEVPSGDDGGARLLAWLEGPVTEAWRAGEAWSEDVPFKLAFAGPESDGMVEPAPVHFEGPLVCFFGPGGGSHLDQFAAMIVDDRLGYTIGMPTGGYSNTWEWSEVLTLPGSGRPLVGYMWTIGQTIRPNGEILEGNPAGVDERVPPTAANGPRYHALLLERAYAHLDGLRD